MRLVPVGSPQALLRPAVTRSRTRCAVLDELAGSLTDHSSDGARERSAMLYNWTHDTSPGAARVCSTEPWSGRFLRTEHVGVTATGRSLDLLSVFWTDQSWKIPV
jgi:hypothetical protein